MQDPLELLAEDFKLLADKTRLKIITLLKQRKELCVCDLVDYLNISQPGVSQHLRRMKSAQLVSEEKRGQWVYYSLNLENKPHITDLLSYLPQEEVSLTANCCANDNSACN